MPPIILVLGMHRSGTSAIAGLLSLLGGEGPREDIGANAGNQRGHFEPRRVVELHDVILAAGGHHWADCWRFNPALFAAGQARAWSAALANAIRANYSLQRPMVVKDPRLCRLVPLWRDVAAGLGAELRVVLAFRHPDEVASSLARRDGLDRGAASLAWLRHVLDAERETRDLPRIVLGYEEVLADWRRAVARISEGLGVPFATAGARAAQADQFISPQLRHEHAGRGAAAPAAAAPWQEDALGALRALRGNPYDSAAMVVFDRLEQALDGEGETASAALLRVGHTAALTALEAARAALLHERTAPLSRLLRSRARAAVAHWGTRGGALRWWIARSIISLAQAGRVRI